MKWPTTAPLALASLLLLFPVPAAADAGRPRAETTPDTHQRDTALEASVDRHIAPYLETGNFSGAVLVARGDRILLSKAYGMANLELEVPNTPSTVFHLASTSKPFTTTAILLLAEDGKLSVDDPLAKFVPDFPRGERIRLHHLMINSTGIPNLNGMPIYGEMLVSPQTPESLVAAFRDAPAEFEPGERYGYSNSNYNLLALVIERASGESFGDFLERRIFAPLGMTDTGHHGEATTVIDRRADGYSPTGLAALERAPWLDWSAKTGNGSIYSTVADLHRFALALTGGEILSEASLQAMFTAHIESAGYGWFVRPRLERPQVHINGRSPGFTSYLGIYPEDGLFVIVLGNVYNSVATEIGEAIAAFTFGLEVEPPRFTRRALPASQTSRIVGSYSFGDAFYNPNWTMRVAAEDGYVFNDGDWLMPTSDSDTRFIHRRYSSELEFFELVDGKYRRVRFDDFEGTRSDDD